MNILPLFREIYCFLVLVLSLISILRNWSGLRPLLLPILSYTKYSLDAIFNLISPLLTPSISTKVLNVIISLLVDVVLIVNVAFSLFNSCNIDLIAPSCGELKPINVSTGVGSK